MATEDEVTQAMIEHLDDRVRSLEKRDDALDHAKGNLVAIKDLQQRVACLEGGSTEDKDSYIETLQAEIKDLQAIVAGDVVFQLKVQANKKRFLSDVPWAAVDKPAPKVSIDWCVVLEKLEAWLIERAQKHRVVNTKFDPEQLAKIEELVEQQLKG